MKNPLSTLLVPALLFAACMKEPTASPAPGTPATPGHGDAHGDKKSLGNLTVGAHTFEVLQYGAIEAGKEGAVDLEFPTGKPVPGTARVWVGIETGVGSMKAKLDKEGDHGMHQHFQVPKPIPAGSKLWIEIEDGANTQRGSLAWK